MRGDHTAPDSIVLKVPFRIVKRGGRKEVHLPPDAPQHRDADDTLVRALARAFRWKRQLDTGTFATIADLARHEQIALSYVTRILRLTLLAPDIVEAILAGRHGPRISLAQLQAGFPEEWDAQRALLGLSKLLLH
ncbi:hypothetical protein RM190_22475 [Paracoccus sp. CPCC 101403]|uniref:Bacteriophage-related protein n=1 Tax=Paracoccus broussonetiae TaxID=3075834 RepID=A0ABU3EMI8_9RHOB|nr:hypothetical protein [Paracoccus sp. CPCC 101403]MDT1064640.1 hypothetical protein [Paracoccus sp. CPCC 101403]